MSFKYEFSSELINFIKKLYPNKDFIGLHEPIFLGNERKYVLDAIDSTFVSSVGKYVDRFEYDLAGYTGSKFAVATVNGTSALHMALIILDVKRDDLVITQPLSFVATCNAIAYTGASPIFVDINKSTLGLCDIKLKEFLESQTVVVSNECIHKTSGKRISACVPMHTFGFPLAVDRIVDLCNEYHIPVIEDAAESLGSMYKNKHTGTFGNVGIYSFNGNKTITAGGGGAIVTNDEVLAKKAKYLTTQAKKQHRWAFEHDELGYNYRMPNINAALACAQLEKIEEFVENKRETAEAYNNFFSEFGNLKFRTELPNSRANYWLNCVQFSDEIAQQEFLNYSNQNGVMTRPCWNLLNTLPMYSGCFSEELSNAEYVFSTLVNLPSSFRKK